MTAKQKANELVDKFYRIDSDSAMYDDFTMKIFYAQRCALICVDEMIKELTEEISPSVHGFRHQYWQEVKQEINKL